MILHIDMDAFYASVEQLDNPWLRGRCVIVGGSSGRGVVSAASYEARKFGVHSAMPVFQAKEKCPDGVFVRPRMHRYREVSRRIMVLLGDITPLVQPISVDEAFMDISGLKRLFGEPEAIGKLVKQKIYAETQLACSVGIAPTKFLAKIASDMDKPDGLYIIREEETDTFIAALPVKKVSGVGGKTEKILSTLGIRTLGDVRKFPESLLERHLGKYGRRLRELSFGEDHSTVHPRSPSKSISTETTLSENTTDRAKLVACLLRQSDEVATELRKKCFRARTVVLKIKHGNFQLVTRSSTLEKPTQSSEMIFREAQRLFKEYPLESKGDVRLIGVGVSGLVSRQLPVQMDLFSVPEKRGAGWDKVDRAMDTIKNRFGKDAIGRATLGDKQGKEE